MALQKRRRGSTRIKNRRSAWMASVKKPLVANCPRCQAPKAQHRVCLKCGYYRDEQIVEVAEETE